MKKILFVLLIIASLTTGCWSRRELNELSIVSAMGIDQGSPTEPFRVSLQLVNPSVTASQKGGAQQITPVSVYSASGKTIFEAIRKASLITPRRTYFSHIQVIVIGESLARQGIRNLLDFLERSGDIRKNIPVVVARQDSAERVISILDPLEKVPAQKITGAIKDTQRIWGSNQETNFMDLIKAVTSESTEPVLGSVHVYGQRDEGENLGNIQKTMVPANVRLTGMAVFKGDKLIGWLNEREGRGYGRIKNKIKGTVINVPGVEQGENISFDVIRTRTSVNADINQGQPVIKIEVHQEGNIADSQSTLDFSNPKVIENIQGKINDETRGEINAVLAKVQRDLQVDIFGFGEAINRSDPRLWKQIKNNWAAIFPKIPVQIEVGSHIRRSGLRQKTPLEKLNQKEGLM